MPVALLLRNVTGTLEAGVRRLQPWMALTVMEEALLGRAASLFVVRWFGPGVPLHGRMLRVAIGNLDALRARYEKVMAERRRTPELSLTEPLAGMGGALLGALASPTGIGIAFGVLLARLVKVVAGLWFALIVVGAGAAGLIVSPIVLGIGLPVLALIAPFVAGSPKAPVLARFLRALAGALDAATTFLNQLLGPRAGVRNPLVRRLLELGGRLAALLFQGVGAASFLVVRGAEALRPLLDQLFPMYRLARAVVEAVGGMLAEVGRRLGRLLHGPGSVSRVIRLVLDRLTLIFELAAAVLGMIPGDLKHRLYTWWHDTRSWGPGGDKGVELKLDEWWTATKDAFAARMRQHPLWAALDAAEARFDVIAEVWASASLRAKRNEEFEKAVNPPDPNSFTSKFAAAFERAVQPSLDAFDRKVPDVKAYLAEPWAGAYLPDVEALAKAAGGWPTAITGKEIERRRARFAGVRARLERLLPDALRPLVAPFAMSDEAQKAVAKARRPTSIFALERKRLADALKQPLSAEAQVLRGTEAELRRALAAVVAGALPESLAAYLVELDDLLREDEARAAGQKEVPPRELPVREILDSRRLQPVVRALRVHARGARRLDADAWADRLARRMGEQAYLAAD